MDLVAVEPVECFGVGLVASWVEVVVGNFVLGLVVDVVVRIEESAVVVGRFAAHLRTWN